MAEAFMAVPLPLELTIVEAFITGPFPAVGDFGVLDLDMAVSSAIPSRTQ